MNWGGDGNQFGDSKMSSFNSPGAGGGGFLDKTFGESPASQSKTFRKSKTVMPLTVAAVFNARHDAGMDSFVLNEIPFHLLSLVGMVVSVTENKTNLSYEIDDFTGRILTVKRWIDQDENPEDYEESRFREDSFIRVCGYIRREDDLKRHVVAFGIYQVTDFNEITYHMFNAIYASLSVQKRKNGEANASISENTTNFGNSNSFSAQRNQFGAGTGNTNKPESRVFQMVKESTAEEGISINEIVRRLKMPEKSVRDFIDNLSNEGLIYSTTDEEHFRYTNFGDE